MTRAPRGALAAFSGVACAVSVVVSIVISTASCGASLKLMTLPAGPGTVAPDAGDALAAATTACRAVSTFRAEVAVSGSVGGRRIPHARLIVGAAAPASVIIEAPAPFGAPAFIFAARGADATLLLPRDGRVLEHGQPDATLEAIAGVPLGPAGLKAALTGCATAPVASDGRHVGDDWIMLPDGDGTLYLLRGQGRTGGNARWQVAAATHGGGAAGSWRAEYRDFRDGLPRTVHLAADAPGRFDLVLVISDVDINVPIDDAAFTIRVPPSASPISLDELRASGPLE